MNPYVFRTCSLGPSCHVKWCWVLCVLIYKFLVHYNNLWTIPDLSTQPASGQPPVNWTYHISILTSFSLSSPVHSQPSLGHLMISDRILLSVDLSGKMSWNVKKIVKIVYILKHLYPFLFSPPDQIFTFCRKIRRTEVYLVSFQGFSVCWTCQWTSS